MIVYLKGVRLNPHLHILFDHNGTLLTQPMIELGDLIVRTLIGFSSLAQSEEDACPV